MNTILSSFPTQPGTALSGRTYQDGSSQSASPRRCPVETIQVKIANQEDELSISTDPTGNIMSSSSKNVSWKLNGAQERINKDTATIRELKSLYSRSYLTQPGTCYQSASRRYPVETINVIINQEDAVSMITDPVFTSSSIRKDKIRSPKIFSTGMTEIDHDYYTSNSRSSLQKLMKVALITGKTPEEVATHLLRREQQKEKEKRRTEMLLTDALKVGKNQKDIAEFLMMKVEETRKALEHKENEICKVGDSDDETAGSTIGSIEDDHPGAFIEVNDESFTVKLISVETSENQEITLVKEYTDDESMIMSDELRIVSTSVLQEMVSDALKVGSKPEDIAAYLLKKEQEQKLEKLRLEQKVTASFKADKSPIEIASVLRYAEEERNKIEKERMAKKANEGAKTPGQEAKKQSIKVQKTENVINKSACGNEDDDNEGEVSETSILAEQESKIELEIQKLKAELGKAELIQKEIEKLRADLVKAEFKINILEGENELPAASENHHYDDEDTSSSGCFHYCS